MRLLCALIVLLVWACSDTEVAGGTAQEGETYVYGQVTDSTGSTVSQVSVYLAKVVISEDGSEQEVVDSTLTDEDGEYEFYPDISDSATYVIQVGDVDQEDDSIGAMVSGVQWPPAQPGGYQVKALSLGSPLFIAGRITNPEVCSVNGLPIKIFIPGTPFSVVLPLDGRFQLPPSPVGRFELGVICDDAVQMIPIEVPPGCSHIVLTDVRLLGESEFGSSPYRPYPTDLTYSVQMPTPEGGLGEMCVDGQIGPMDGPITMGPHPSQPPIE